MTGAYSNGVLERPLRMAAIALSFFVATSWLLFAIGESKAASDLTQQELAGRQATSDADPSPDQERAREKAHSSVHEFIDDVNDVLLSPFAGIAGSASNKWVRRTVPAAIALFVYGFGLAYLARYATGRP
jgi:hypothetical protein